MFVTISDNEEDIKINEADIKRIVREYFRGDSLENVQFDWQEVINGASFSNYLFDSCKIKEGIKATGKRVYSNIGKNSIPLTLQVLKLLVNTGIEHNRYDNLQREKIRRERKLREWVLETATKNDNLKNKIATDPKLIVLSYKIDMGEEIAWFYVTTNHFNNRFGVNWSPLTLFSFLIGGLFGLVWVGYQFVNRVRAMVRNNNETSQENNHED